METAPGTAHGRSTVGPKGYTVPLALSLILLFPPFLCLVTEAGQVDTFDDGSSSKEFRIIPGHQKAYANISVPANGHVISANMWLEPSPWTDAGKVEHSEALFKANMSSSSNLLVDNSGISLRQRQETWQAPRAPGTGWSSGNHTFEMANLEELGNGSLTLSPSNGPSFKLDTVVDASLNSQDYPDIAVDKYGTAHIAWQDNRRFWGVYYSKSLPDGSFMPAVKVDDQLDITTQNQPSIVVDSKDAIHVVFSDNRNENPDIYYTRSSNGGQDWVQNIHIDQDPSTGKNGSKQETPNLAIDSNDLLHVVWKDARNGNWTVMYTSMTSNGFAPGPEIRVTSATGNQTDPAVAVAPDGRVHVFWRDDRSGKSRIYHARLNDTKDGFIDVAPVDPNMSATYGDQYWPEAAIDQDGRAYIVWTDDSEGGLRVYCARSDDGMTFTPKVAVTSTMIWNYAPSISVDSKGTVHVAWYDYRYDAGDIIYANSTDRGAHFSANVLVNDRLVNVTHRNPVIGAAQDGSVHISWVDLRGGGADIYYSRSMPCYVPSGSVLVQWDIGREPTTLDRFTSAVGLEFGQWNVTNISFEIRTSHDNSTWTVWKPIVTDALSSNITPGRYVGLRATLSSFKGPYRPYLSLMALDISIYELAGQYTAKAAAVIEHMVTDLSIDITATYLNGTADPSTGTILEMSFDGGTSWAAVPVGMPTFLNEHVSSIDYRLSFSSNGSGSPHVEAVTISYGMTSTPSDVALLVGDVQLWNGKGEMGTTLRTDDLAGVINEYLEKQRTGSEGPDDRILVPVMISSSTPGTVQVSKVLLDIALPPSIDAAVPSETEVDIDEGSSVDFQVTATELDERPLTYNWSLDGKPVAGAGGVVFEQTFDYNSSGAHTVMMTVSNGHIDVSRVWDVTVRDVNRPPEITAVSPQGTAYAMEKELFPFDVTASDPDGEALTYTWYLDNAVIGGQDSNFLDLTPEAGTAGQHILTVEVSDGKDTVSYNWTMKVDALPKNDNGNGMDYRIPLAAMVILVLVLIIAMELYLSRQRDSRRMERKTRRSDVDTEGHQEERDYDKLGSAPVVKKKTVKKVTKKKITKKSG